jgi:hypothetical protein
LLYFFLQICRRNSKSVNIYFSSFLQRSFLYFHLCRLSVRMIKGTSCKTRWRSKEENFRKTKTWSNEKHLFSLLHTIVIQFMDTDHFATPSLSIVIVIRRNYCQSLLLFVTVTVRHNHRPSPFVAIPSMTPFITVRHSSVRCSSPSIQHTSTSIPFHPPTSICYLSSPSTCRIFQIICITYIRIRYHILQTICMYFSKLYISFL